MISLFAPWLFRNVMVQDGGPIERLSFRTNVNSFGLECFEFQAYLKPELAPQNSLVLYGSCHGSGTDVSRQIAMYKALSEAIERWACFHFLRSDSEFFAKYGFDQEPSTTGMAAFPGLFARSARENGYAEAVERWAIPCWWNGLISCKRLTTKDPFNVLFLQTPFAAEMAVVVLWRKNPQKGLVAYGFAAAKGLESAIKKASVELDRNEQILEYFYRNDSKIDPSFILERRLLWFASTEGHEYFASHVSRTESVQSLVPQPKLVVDCEIRGSWSKYAKVWRCLFERTAPHDDLTSEHIFSF